LRGELTDARAEGLRRAALMCAARPAWADEPDHSMAGMDHDGHDPVARTHGEMEPMHELHAGPLGLPHSRTGSGTSWLPDSTPMHALMTRAGGWDLMLHANVFVGYTSFGGDRGDSEVTSVNWVMGMASHQLGGGELTLRTMLSLEPLTVGDEGYPLLLQTGETADGEPLHDRQHPHDLFMELAALYSTAVTDDIGVQVYVAPAGEPALGPTAFPHRISAMADPLAPLGHHWEDSTHITFGVLTLGVFTGDWKLEGSWFNGREPDENRWDLDLRAPDSYSTRLSWNPGPSWALQASYGYLASPETLEPDVSVQRITASVMRNDRMGSRNLATTLAYGQNVESTGDSTPALLLESTLDLDARNTLFGRAEYVRKSGHHLVLPEPMAEQMYDLGSIGLGAAHYFDPVGGFQAGLGVRGSAMVLERDLEPVYGTRVPLGAMLFLQIRPAAML
jgi:hypothetical protein